MVELIVGDTKLITYRSLEQEVLHPGDQVSVLVHRAYLFNDNESWIEENKLKTDPLPIFI
ncbi:hypothetical protein D3C80_1976060 [compost metagenome]